NGDDPVKISRAVQGFCAKIAAFPAAFKGDLPVCEQTGLFEVARHEKSGSTAFGMHAARGMQAPGFSSFGEDKWRFPSRRGKHKPRALHDERGSLAERQRLQKCRQLRKGEVHGRYAEKTSMSVVHRATGGNGHIL